MRIQLVGHAPGNGEIEIDGAADLQGPFAAWVRVDGRPTGALLVDRPALMTRARRLLLDAATPVGGAMQPPDKEDNDGLSSRDRRVGLPGTR
jgi:hypothetical protein